ncbi:transposase, partial [Kingella kingae]
DGSHIRVHQHGMGKKSIVYQAVGKSIGGHTSKIHLAVNACGNPIEFMITAGNINDIVQALGRKRFCTIKAFSCAG